jgi:hypothetical protein
MLHVAERLVVEDGRRFACTV